MKLLILHYHLQPGGVTRIVNSQLIGLLQHITPEDITVLASEADGAEIPEGVNLHLVEEFGYLDADVDRETCHALLIKIQTILDEHLTSDTVIHAHNLNLGKNPVLTYAIAILAGSGIPVLSHCHDFAEDGRPENETLLKKVVVDYFSAKLHPIMYPNLPNFLYGILNSTDRQRLIDFGVERSKINFLANPVQFPDPNKIKMGREEIVKELELKENLPICTYPVRVIRRKNIGEYILLATLFADQANWLVTMRPRNPIEAEPYERWKKFCSLNNLPIHFEVGEKVDFNDLMFNSDRCVTTSTKEGFGMAFLEPWTYGNPIVGRNLPAVTGDFAKSGLKLPILYNQLNVPFSEVDDFPQLPELQQMEVISKVLNSPGIKQELFSANPKLETILTDIPEHVVAENAELIKKQYSINSYGDQLYVLYRSLSEST